MKIKKKTSTPYTGRRLSNESNGLGSGATINYILSAEERNSTFDNIGLLAGRRGGVHHHSSCHENKHDLGKKTWLSNELRDPQK